MLRGKLLLMLKSILLLLACIVAQRIRRASRLWDIDNDLGDGLCFKSILLLNLFSVDPYLLSLVDGGINPMGKIGDWLWFVLVILKSILLFAGVMF